jgi:hypothetical protein
MFVMAKFSYISSIAAFVAGLSACTFHEYHEIFSGTLTFEMVSQSIEEPIPKGYDTYSLFLICDPAWLLKNQHNKERIANLHKQFLAFGDSLGDKHLAVWLWKASKKTAPILGLDPEADKVIASLLDLDPEANPDPEAYPDLYDYDAGRASAYCSKYKLHPSKSPYVLITTFHPDLTNDGTLGDYYYLGIGEIDPEVSIKILSNLTDKILVSGLKQEEIDSERYWISWLSLIQESLSNLRNIAANASLTIDTKFFKIDFSNKGSSEEK